MEQYKNLSGRSGVKAFLSGLDYIEIEFFKGGIYLYDSEKPGLHHVENMKLKAEEGIGLNTYINQHVKGNFASKIS